MWIYCLAVNRDLTDDEFYELVSGLRPETAQRVARVKHRESAVRALLSEILARSVLADHSGVSPSELEFSVGEHGKPGLVGSPWHYNISHSGEWVVCAVSELQPVGVDVERVREANLRVAQRFHPRELERIMQTPPAERDRVFFKIWTAKESFLKAVGIGISLALNSFWADDETRTIRIDDATPFVNLGVDVESGWHFDVLPLGEGYRLTASTRVREEHQLVRLNVDEAIRRWRN
jgi:4'-phosphopantetheinyl transferase